MASRKSVATPDETAEKPPAPGHRFMLGGVEFETIPQAEMHFGALLVHDRRARAGSVYAVGAADELIHRWLPPAQQSAWDEAVAGSDLPEVAAVVNGVIAFAVAPRPPVAPTSS